MAIRATAWQSSEEQPARGRRHAGVPRALELAVFFDDLAADAEVEAAADADDDLRPQEVAAAGAAAGAAVGGAVGVAGFGVLVRRRAGELVGRRRDGPRRRLRLLLGRRLRPVDFAGRTCAAPALLACGDADQLAARRAIRQALAGRRRLFGDSHRTGRGGGTANGRRRFIVEQGGVLRGFAFLDLLLAGGPRRHGTHHAAFGALHLVARVVVRYGRTRRHSPDR